MSLLLNPRSGIAKEDHERYVLSVDSADRDKAMFPNQNNYRINIPHEYRRIRRISLLSAEFENTQYVIDSDNDKFVVTYTEDTTAGTTPITGIVAMQHGTYTGASFAAQIESEINQFPAFKNAPIRPIASSAGVTYDADTRKLSVVNSGVDTIAIPNITPVIVFDVLASQDVHDTTGRYSPNLMWDAMGYTQKHIDFPNAPVIAIRRTVAPIVTPAAVAASIVARSAFWLAQDITDSTWPVSSAVVADPSLGIAPETVNITPDRYAILEVSFPSIMQGAMRTTGNHHATFAKIIFADVDDNSPFGNIYDFISAPVVFQMVNRLNHIGFKLKRPNGNLYSTHNHDHSFTIEILCE